MTARLYFFNHHKCGSQLVNRYLTAFCQLNDLSFFSNHRGDIEIPDIPKSKHVVHMKNAHHAMKASGGLHIVRNPLSVVTSAYFSHLNSHRIDDWERLGKQRAVLSQLDKGRGIWATIDFLFETEFYPLTPGPLLAMSEWDYDDARFTTVRMENLTQDIAGTIGQHYDLSSFALPDPEKFTFRALSGRNVGDVKADSHFRSGDPKDYVNHLDEQHIEYIKIRLENVFERFYPEV